MTSDSELTPKDAGLGSWPDPGPFRSERASAPTARLFQPERPPTSGARRWNHGEAIRLSIRTAEIPTSVDYGAPVLGALLRSVQVDPEFEEV